MLLEGAMEEEGISSTLPKLVCTEFSGLPGQLVAGKH